MIFILLIWGILGIKEGSASNSLPYEKIPETLRHRKTSEHEFRESSLSLIDEKPISKKTQNNTLLDTIIDKDNVFSCLGSTWENFKNKEFNLYFSSLNQFQSKKSPEALYLMGVVYEEGLGKIHKSLKQTIHWYTLSLAYAEKNSPLYDLALEALQRCIEKSDPSKLFH